MEHPEVPYAEWLAGLHRDLHDLCQPLTALQCQLEVGRMQDDLAGLREAVGASLVETRRLFATVARMRLSLQQQDEVQRSIRRGSQREADGGDV